MFRRLLIVMTLMAAPALSLGVAASAQAQARPAVDTALCPAGTGNDEKCWVEYYSTSEHTQLVGWFIVGCFGAVSSSGNTNTAYYAVYAATCPIGGE
jgi:hypothetical protein